MTDGVLKLGYTSVISVLEYIGHASFQFNIKWPFKIIQDRVFRALRAPHKGLRTTTIILALSVKVPKI